MSNYQRTQIEKEKKRQIVNYESEIFTKKMTRNRFTWAKAEYSLNANVLDSK